MWFSRGLMLMCFCFNLINSFELPARDINDPGEVVIIKESNHIFKVIINGKEDRYDIYTDAIPDSKWLLILKAIEILNLNEPKENDNEDSVDGYKTQNFEEESSIRESDGDGEMKIEDNHLESEDEDGFDEESDDDEEDWYVNESDDEDEGWSDDEEENHNLDHYEQEDIGNEVNVEGYTTHNFEEESAILELDGDDKEVIIVKNPLYPEKVDWLGPESEFVETVYQILEFLAPSIPVTIHPSVLLNESFVRI